MKAKYTGHDTFPLRYGWLYKSINHLNYNGKFQTSNEDHTRDAIVKLGVGKNMVNAIRYWAESSSFVEPKNESGRIEHSVSALGEFIFGSSDEKVGVDPYLERVGSVWLVHFLLNFNYDSLTAYRYFFNYSNVQNFEKKKLLDEFVDDAVSLTQSDVTNVSTLRKDLDCFINTYSKRRKAASSKKSHITDEDHFSSPLTELNLLKESGNSFYISELSDRRSLPIEIFIFALLKFIAVENQDSRVNTIEFDAILSKPCSPGRIFRLSESALGHKLDEAQSFSGEAIKWIDSLGLRQVRVTSEALASPEVYLYKFYGDSDAK